jgi:hypothetical protein
MGTFKVADLSPEVRQQLGYVVAEKPKAGTNAATAWAKQTFARIETPQIKEVEKQVEQRWRACFPNGRPTLPPVDKTALWLVLGAVLLGYLFFSYCCQLICQKAGKQPGIMAWLPLLQQIALLHAAEMSGWWFLAGFVPVLNLVAAIIWCFKIARTRGKSAWVGLLLLLPVTTLFAFLYLAFSDRVPRKEKSKRLVQVMSLEIA